MTAPFYEGYPGESDGIEWFQHSLDEALALVDIDEVKDDDDG